MARLGPEREPGVAVAVEELGPLVTEVPVAGLPIYGRLVQGSHARIVAQLRAASDLAGRSRPDPWIATSAVRWATPLVTRDARHFGGIPGLDLLTATIGVMGYSIDRLVTRSDDMAWGAAVIAGTRVPVDTLFEYLERGKTLDDFLEQFPTVSRDKAVAILESARQGLTAQAASR